MVDILGNIEDLDEKIRTAARKAGRRRRDITLVAVSKKQPDSRIDMALEAGHRFFGENRVQEAVERWSERRKTHLDLRLHCIGPLQTNKVKDAVALFDVIETVDREKLARKLGEVMRERGDAKPCFVQVNTGQESQKSGIAPESLSDFLHYCRRDCGLRITGLMCIPPLEAPPEEHFKMLRDMAARHNIAHLSMGMSNDFEEAIALGATHIRVGTGFFGPRPKN